MALPPHDTVLLRYGEIGIKSQAVRNRLERDLMRHLEDGLLRRKTEAYVRRDRGRIYIESRDIAGACEVARHTMGITTYSPVVRIGADFDAILATAAEYARAHWTEPTTRFAIRARRSGDHRYTSQDIAIQAGSAVYKAREADGHPVQVDLKQPEFELHIEVRDKDAYLFHERMSGPGGLPLGSQGRMVVVLDSGDAAAAAYLMMRRGAQVYPIYLPARTVDEGTLAHLSSNATPNTTPIATSSASVNGPATENPDDAHPVRLLHERLRAWNAPKMIRAAKLDRELPEILGAHADDPSAPLPDEGVPYQRAMLDAAARYAGRVKAQAIVTGETQRSTWLKRLPETQEQVMLPVLRPLLGLTRPLIDDFREMLDLPRLGGARANEADRAFTAGGRREGRTGSIPDRAVDDGSKAKDEIATPSGGWDPW